MSKEAPSMTDPVASDDNPLLSMLLLLYSNSSSTLPSRDPSRMLPIVPKREREKRERVNIKKRERERERKRDEMFHCQKKPNQTKQETKKRSAAVPAVPILSASIGLLSIYKLEFAVPLLSGNARANAS